MYAVRHAPQLTITIMPRGPKDSRQSSSLKLESLYRKCRYCNTNRPTRRFDKHQKACKVQWEIRRERGASESSKATHLPVKPEAEKMRSSPGYYEPESVPGSSAITVDMADRFPSPVPGRSASVTCDDDFTADSEQTGEY